MSGDFEVIFSYSTPSFPTNSPKDSDLELDEGSNPPGKPGRKKNPKYSFFDSRLLVTLLTMRQSFLAPKLQDVIRIVSHNASFV